MKLRDATAQDVATLADILRSATRQAYTFMAWSHSDESFEDFVRHSMTVWDAVRIAECENEAVGFACLEGDLVDQLFVRPAWQGNGVGSLLLDDIKRLRPQGFRLYTFEKNLAARAFYERHGLIETGRGFGEQEQEADIAYRWDPQ